MIYNKIKRVCITGTAYNLFFNLLIVPEELLPYTYFITCDTVPAMFRNKLRNAYNVSDMHHIGRIRKVWYLVKFQLLRSILSPYLNNAEIYAQDHLPFTPLVLGKSKYILTEDAPGVMSIAKGQKYVLDSWKSMQNNNKASLKNILYGHTNYIRGGIYGRNELCQKVILSNDQYADWLDLSMQQTVNLQNLWDSSSNNKRQYILDIFSVTDEDIAMLRSRKVILFTQPFYEDGDVSSLDEHIAIYRDTLSKYNEEDVVIKMHPREHTQYIQYFPKAKIYNKPVPFQLLNLLGVLP